MPPKPLYLDTGGTTSEKTLHGNKAKCGHSRSYGHASILNVVDVITELLDYRVPPLYTVGILPT